MTTDVFENDVGLCANKDIGSGTPITKNTPATPMKSMATHKVCRLLILANVFIADFLIWDDDRSLTQPNIEEPGIVVDRIDALGIHFLPNQDRPSVDKPDSLPII